VYPFCGAGPAVAGRAWAVVGGWPVCRLGARVARGRLWRCLHRERGRPMRIASEAGRRLLVVAGAMTLAATALLQAPPSGPVRGRPR